MKLTKVHIKNYKCIHDSTEFDIDDIVLPSEIRATLIVL